MDFVPNGYSNYNRSPHHDHLFFYSSFTKFNTELTTILLNLMAPPLESSNASKPKSSPTFFEMMASEPNL